MRLTAATVVFVSLGLQASLQTAAMQVRLANRSPRSSLCSHGKHLPEFYLLGCQKCATTSLSLDLIDAGIQSPTNFPDGEFDYFDGGILEGVAKVTCHLTPPHAPGDVRARSLDPIVNVSAWGMASTAKREPEPSDLAERWRSCLPACPTQNGSYHQVLADMTPVNLAMTQLPKDIQPSPGKWPHIGGTPIDFHLPQQLSGFYGSFSSKKLTFAVILREPLARFHSRFYYLGAEHYFHRLYGFPSGFSDAILFSVKEARQNRYTVLHWEQLYGRQLEAWSSVFDTSQFVVIPMKEYVERNTTGVCRTLEQRLGPLKCWTQPRQENSGSRKIPPLEKDITAEARAAWDGIMVPENDRLVKLLTHFQSNGASLANYAGSGSERTIRKWLEAGW